MTKSWAMAALTLCLAGCYTVDDERFATHVQSLVRPGMPLEESIAVLRQDGFTCDPAPPMPSKTCSRRRQLLLPSACAERVNVYAGGKPHTVERLEVRKIVCTGL